MRSSLCATKQMPGFLLRSKRIFPAQADTLTAYKLTPLSSIKVVILGQDPYHGPGQAHGLSFSVPRGVKPLPPSLRNMIKESENSLKKGSSSKKAAPMSTFAEIWRFLKNHRLSFADEPGLGDLSCWAAQGVFLLNTVLTVRAASANSHAKHGWETFTDATIKYISDNTNNVVFLLWGKSAQSKSALISSSKHLVLKSVHPSPLSGMLFVFNLHWVSNALICSCAAYRGFFGCGHFSKVNEHLTGIGQAPIDWSIQTIKARAPGKEGSISAAAASGSSGD